MIRFPIHEFPDGRKCYEFLVEILHREGLRCPRCKTDVSDCRAHRRDRAPVLYCRCFCGRIFNAFTDTDWQETRHSCSKILRILQGTVQGTPTLHLAEEPGLDRKHLPERCHRIQSRLFDNRFQGIFSDTVTEVDEMYQNAGKKGVFHPDPDDPPPRRGNSTGGHGTRDTDRPPVQGIAGR